MAAGGEFVDGWLVAQVLGEGSYGEVRLLVHGRSGASVALKAVRGAAEGGAREGALHRALRHPNVLRCLGERAHRGLHYLFLEYASGGELFDRIEPEAGTGEAAARRYWRQLLAGLRYVHARGVAHRDIKPENLLLDHRDTLKISDFGMATLFRHGGRERLLARRCGTLPYAAPEVLAAERQPYRARPADLWAAALVLYAMLLGELPWERAEEEEPRYAAWSGWCEGSGPAPAACRRLSPGALALLRRALHPDAARRPSVDELLAHRWLAEEQESRERLWSSQPCGGGGGGAAGWGGGAAGGGDGGAEVERLSARDMDALLSYSQPAHGDDLLVESAGGAAEGGVLQRLVRRMTRVFVRCSEAEALRALGEALAARSYTWRPLGPRLLAIECGEVKMRAWAVRVRGGGPEPRVMLEFRRSRGCGLAFKRRYVELRDALQHLSAPPPAAADLLARIDAQPPAAPMDTT